MRGSILRHTLVMTATGSIGIFAVFAVDLLSLIYVSWLGRTELKAAVGFASQALFFAASVNIGAAIAVTAVVSRALGAGDRPRARRLAGSGLALSAALGGGVAIVALMFHESLLTLLGARGETLALARHYLVIALAGNVPFALGMVLAGVLRAVGDARRAMYVSLAGGIVTALIDPILIFGLGLGIEGAAAATVVSRFVFLVVGLHGAIRVHRLVARPDPASVLGDARVFAGIAVPAILTNLATPVGNGYALHVIARFGDAAVAAAAIIDRLVPVTFAVLFALSGTVGPILGQNLGAARFDRLSQTLTRCFGITAAYVLAAWAVLALAAPALAFVFQVTGDTAAYLTFFCRYGVSAWLFVGFLFVANAAFNNLGFPMLSTVFNWGRATLGTLPFATIGAAWGGVPGIQLGIAFGAAIFGTAALLTAYRAVGRIARQAEALQAGNAEAVATRTEVIPPANKFRANDQRA